MSGWHYPDRVCQVYAQLNGYGSDSVAGTAPCLGTLPSKLNQTLPRQVLKFYSARRNLDRFYYYCFRSARKLAHFVRILIVEIDQITERTDPLPSGVPAVYLSHSNPIRFSGRRWLHLYRGGLVA